MQEEKLSPAQVAIYADKYLKMRKHSVELFLDCHITTAEGAIQFDLRNHDLLRKWQYKIEKESGILYYSEMNDIELHCLRYLAMREESCWHIKSVRLALNSPENVKKSKEQFDSLAENYKLHHASGQ